MSRGKVARWAAALAAITVLSVMAAGCGGDDDESGAAGGTTAATTGGTPEGMMESLGTGEGRVDVIIWATGMTLDFLSTIDILGRQGARLRDLWADDNPQTYLGGTVPGFPNLFVNDGPNTGIATGGGGHNFMSETVNHYALECLQLMIEHGASGIEVKQEAHDRLAATRARHQATAR